MTNRERGEAMDFELSEEQKNELMNFFESQYQGNVSFRDQRQAENVAFLEKIANDTSLTQEQKKEAIKARREKQKAEAMARMREQRAKREAGKDNILSKLKSKTKAATPQR